MKLNTTNKIKQLHNIDINNIDLISLDYELTDKPKLFKSKSIKPVIELVNAKPMIDITQLTKIALFEIKIDIRNSYRGVK